MAKIYAEIKQSKPLRVPGQEAHITILRTADVLRHAVERAMSPFAISSEQYNVLRILRGAGGAGLATLEIADRMLSRSPNITRLVDNQGPGNDNCMDTACQRQRLGTVHRSCAAIHAAAGRRRSRRHGKSKRSAQRRSEPE